jgi:hypothetical protein
MEEKKVEAEVTEVSSTSPIEQAHHQSELSESEVKKLHRKIGSLSSSHSKFS